MRAFWSLILLSILEIDHGSWAQPSNQEAADRWALAAPTKVEDDVKTLASYLSAERPSVIWDPRVRFWTKNASGDEFKARAIYRWIADRIAYRLTIPAHVNNHEYLGPDGRYWSSEVSPEATLKRRTAYCVSYAVLFQALAEEANLRVLYIEGRAGTKGDMGEHAWNAVKIGENWRMIDATWGAGTGAGDSFRKVFDGRWCLTTPKSFYLSHKPGQEGLQEPCYHFLSGSNRIDFAHKS